MKAARILSQPVAMAVAYLQVWSIRRWTCRALRVIRAATCSTWLRKVVISEFMSLDGVVQAPGGAWGALLVCYDSDTTGGTDANIVLYLYNPFDDSVMETVVSKVEAFLRETNRQVYVLYHHPNHRAVWDNSKAFQALKTHGRCAIYASRK